MGKFWYDKIVKTTKTHTEDYELYQAQSVDDESGATLMFTGITQAPNQPETEFKRVPALLSEDIDHELTLHFLDDVINSDLNSSYSLLNSISPRVCIDFYWNKYKYWTMGILQLPYVISMILFGLITVFGNFKKHE